VAANADGLFHKSTAGERKPVQKQRILCVTAVELKMHQIKTIEPRFAITIRQGEIHNVTIDAHQGGSQ
jgi:hypothetical protein